MIIMIVIIDALKDQLLGLTLCSMLFEEAEFLLAVFI